MLRYQQQFAFFDHDAVNTSVRFINLSDVAAEGDLEKVLHRIVEEVRAVGPGLVFVDSFRSVVMSGVAEGVPDKRGFPEPVPRHLSQAKTGPAAT